MLGQKSMKVQSVNETSLRHICSPVPVFVVITLEVKITVVDGHGIAFGSIGKR